MTTTILHPGMGLSEIANMKIKEVEKNVDKSEPIQSLIHEEVNLYRNSINHLVGKHSRGKSQNVFFEIIKIDILQYHGEFTILIIVSDI
jgi:hypothetical protein